MLVFFYCFYLYYVALKCSFQLRIVDTLERHPKFQSWEETAGHLPFSDDPPKAAVTSVPQ